MVCALFVSAQDSASARVDELPRFPGGEAKLARYIVKHLEYPSAMLENKIEGKVTVRFVVTSHGEVKQLYMTNDIGGGAAEEIARVFRGMPRWKPGLLNGEPVNVQMSMPVIFRLPEEKVSKRKHKRHVG